MGVPVWDDLHDAGILRSAAPDNCIVEMESYGQERTLLPCESVFNVETWKLVAEVFDWKDPDRLISIAG